MTKSRFALTVLFLLSVAGGTSHAALIIDQEHVYSPPNSILTEILAEGSAFSGQIVTTGVTGYLTAVELRIEIKHAFTIPFMVEIYEASDGSSTGRILCSTAVDADSLSSHCSYSFKRVDLSSPVFLEAGDQFAIVIHPEGVEGEPGLFAGGWAGDVSDSYTGGQAVHGPNTDCLMPQNYDLHFRTYVENAVPIPAAGWLLASGAVVLAGMRNQFRKK